MFFDIGFSEIFLLAVLGLLILGPERLPAVARTLGGWVRRGRKMAEEFQRELEREVDLKEIKGLKNEVEQAVQPLREAVEEGNSILDKSLLDADKALEFDPDNQTQVDTMEPHEPMPSTESSDWSEGEAGIEAEPEVGTLDVEESDVVLDTPTETIAGKPAE